MKQIFVAYVDNTTAPPHERVLFAFSRENIRRTLMRARQDTEISGCVLLATCERTELYISAENITEQKCRALLSEFAPIPVGFCIDSAVGVISGEPAMKRLFNLACGLRSRLVFEDQILGQIGEAFAFAGQLRCTDDTVSRLFSSAISCAGRIKTEVSFARNADALSSEVLRLVCEYAGNKTSLQYSNIRCLIIGSGKTAVAAGHRLKAAGANVRMTLRGKHIGMSVVPRDLDVIDYDARLTAAEDADVIIGATKSPHYTLSGEEAVRTLSDGRHRLLIDLAFPHDFDETLGDISGVTIVNLEDILMKASAGTELSEAIDIGRAKTAALAIIDETYEKLLIQLKKRSYLPVIEQVADTTAERIVRRVLKNESDTGTEGRQVIFAMLADMCEAGGDEFYELLCSYAERERPDGTSIARDNPLYLKSKE